jgi:MinD-like ATPase involved in chromosome partitioning or flagellar assembly
MTEPARRLASVSPLLPPRAPRRSLAFVAPGVDGAVVRERTLGRLTAGARSLLRRRALSEELAVEARLRSIAPPSRANAIAVASPRGGVGKTAMALAVGDLLAGSCGLRTVVLDADPGFGTLGSLVADRMRCDATPGDLLEGLDAVRSAADLSAYASRMPSGLHVIAAPPGASGGLDPARLGELIAFLSHHYEIVVLDLPAGMEGSAQSLALSRADQTLVIAAGDWAGGASVLGALGGLGAPRVSVVMNRARAGGEPRLAATESVPGAHRAERTLLTVPEDARLRASLDAGTYALGALAAATRLQIKRLGLAVAQQLV